MEDKYLNIPQMLLIGSTGRNSGKTTLAVQLINELKKDFYIIGLKVTTIKEEGGKCPRGGNGCGVCYSIKDKFELIEETNEIGNKDTSLLLAAGAEKVYWLKTLWNYNFEGIKHFLEKIPQESLIVCESNSLRKVVKPGVFIMLKCTKEDIIKKSASEVIEFADISVNDYNKESFEEIKNMLKVKRGQFNLLT